MNGKTVRERFFEEVLDLIEQGLIEYENAEIGTTKLADLHLDSSRSFPSVPRTEQPVENSRWPLRKSIIHRSIVGARRRTRRHSQNETKAIGFGKEFERE